MSSRNKILFILAILIFIVTIGDAELGNIRLNKGKSRTGRSSFGRKTLGTASTRKARALKGNRLKLKAGSPKMARKTNQLKTKTRVSLTPSDIPVARMLMSGPSRGNRRRLQEVPSASLPFAPMKLDNVFSKILKVGDVSADEMASLLNGGWRTLGKKINDDSIPPTDVVLQCLTRAGDSVTKLSSQLDESMSAIDLISMLNQPIDQQEAKGQGLGQLTSSFESFGIFGIRGLLNCFPSCIRPLIFPFSSSSSPIQPISNRVIKSPLFNRFFAKMASSLVGGFGLSDIDSEEISVLTTAMQAASSIEEDVRLLGAQVDCLMTMFSSGVQIPFIQSLVEVEKSFSLLMGDYSDVNLWTMSVMALQQVKENLLRLPLAWTLQPNQAATVVSSVGIIDQLLTAIGEQGATVDTNFLSKISTLLQSLGKSVLSLNGTTLVPAIGFNGVDISGYLSAAKETVLSFPLNLLDLKFLQNGFGVPFSLIQERNSLPVILGSGAQTPLSQDSSSEFFSNLVAKTVTAVPTMLAEAVQSGALLSSIADSLTTSLQLSSHWDASTLARVGETLNGQTGLTNVLSRYLPTMGSEGTVPLSNAPVSEGQLISFVKLLKLENAMSNAQNVISGLSATMNSVQSAMGTGSENFKKVFLGFFIPEDTTRTPQASSVNLIDALAGTFLSFSPVRNLPQVLNNFDLLNLMNSNHNHRRRLQEVPVHGGDDNGGDDYTDRTTCDDGLIEDASEIWIEEEWVESALDLKSASPHSIALFVASSTILSALDVAELTALEALSMECLSEAEIEAATVVRAAALAGNPVDVMKAANTTDAMILDVLGSSVDDDGVKDQLFEISSLHCEERKKAFELLREWVSPTREILSNVLANSLTDTPDAIQDAISDLSLLVSQIPRKPFGGKEAIS